MALTWRNPEEARAEEWETQETRADEFGNPDDIWGAQGVDRRQTGRHCALYHRRLLPRTQREITSL
ncbi:uncharacterized protein CPUR_08810 [Claviceps purpurea 20.1]|uniref:Uncharacterized protein n=1 Tax=Claviceps purpurea (strain 20.1) TaxID=1111077 RepID=M1W6U3_CLAP2|nr:uncharacterized protein CPUR_08810 [Claviceps purpurea 20.1]